MAKCIIFLSFNYFLLFFLGEEAISEELPSPICADSTQVRFWNITARTGEIILTCPDTFLTDYFNKTNIEGKGIAIAYLGNWGSPTQSRVFFERKETSPFLFQDAYSIYRKAPDSFHFINTKIPYSTLTYQRAGSLPIREDLLRSLLTFNFGKKFNFGFDIDYLYARGYYQSQSAKYTNWSCFGNYISNHHQFHYLINPFDYIHAENGGIIEDNLKGFCSRDIPTYLNSTWNKLVGKQIYLNYHYCFGFEKISDKDQTKKFIPITNAIYTLDYNDCQDKFYSDDSTSVANFYKKKQDNFIEQIGGVNDFSSYSSVSNTFAISMREGFSSWMKDGWTLFLTRDFRFFTLMDNRQTKQIITYIGSECAKKTGKIRYYTQGIWGINGENKGDFNISSVEEISIPCCGSTIVIKAYASEKDISPTYFETHYISKYFKWDNQFHKTQKTHFGFTFDVPKTNTHLQLQFVKVNRLIYFNESGNPQQNVGKIRIFGATVNQNFKIRAFHSDNQSVYQVSDNPNILPLPSFVFYSSMYFQYIVANSLTIQAGINAHFWTQYYAPFYEPAIQQFTLQHKLLIGNYPLINGFLNCRLKQTRFFIEYYNAGVAFLSPPNYFSLPHYPINPPSIKLGLSIDFFN